MAAKSTTEHGLAFWHHELAEHQMPVFAETARTIVRRAAAADSSASELARLILQDVSMTARVLRMANSIYFNPSGGKVTTISRAIVLLGFDVVRDICLSISLIDTFLRGPHREVVVAEMAHCFHAAMQAKGLAELSRQHDTEEVFIATLLFHLGTLSFWCFAAGIDDSAAARLRAARRGGLVDEKMEREVLGFRLQELTALLNRDWKLSPLLAAVLDPSVPSSPRSRAVGFGHELARALAGAPGAPSLDDVLARIRRSFNIKTEETQARILHNARAAADTIARLGAPEAARLIPVPGSFDLPTAESTGEATVHASDSGLQLEILRELSQLMLEPKPDVNLMLEMVLEGIFRGVGMDRAVFALLSQDRSSVRAKFVLGADRDLLQKRFVFEVGAPPANRLAAALHDGQPAWIGGPDGDKADPQLQEISGGQCFLMPLAVAGKPIGCLYADRACSGRPMTDELYAQFKLFGQQARMGLSYLKGH
jgi:HD-like signal output (HDOD) protein